MHLIIPGSLPPSTIARELLDHVKTHCPALTEQMSRLTPTQTLCPPEETGCTSLECLELTQKGFLPAEGFNLSTGLGPLRAGMTASDEKVWIADLCSVAVGREGARLIPPQALTLESEEANALFDAVKPLWEHSEISALPIGTGRWRVWLPRDATLLSITPEAVSSLSVSDWWPQDPSMKTWRKLLNEVQMVWHDHPVNEKRVERGLPPVNSLWLYGGAFGWKPVQATAQPTFYHGLTKSFLESDWGAWIEELPALSAYINSIDSITRLTLTGERRTVTLTPKIRHWWQAFLPRRTQNWMNWWTLQN